MEYSSVQLMDLPDEILMIIFKKLNKSLLLYSLLGLNKRLNKILYDSYFTNDLPLLKSCCNGKIYPLSDSILDRFYLQILPEICHKINWLHLEPLSMEDILLATNYPNLYGLGLYMALKKALVNISFLLRCLHFCSSSISRQQVSFGRSPPTVFLSTLIELHVTVYNLNDCLYLLDGRFNQLRTFNVGVILMSSTHPKISNEGKLPNLRCFSLYCNSSTDVYDELIIPLLHRMSNLEQLELYLLSCENQIFVDGNNLKANVTDYMP